MKALVNTRSIHELFSGQRSEHLKLGGQRAICKVAWFPDILWIQITGCWPWKKMGSKGVRCEWHHADNRVPTIIFQAQHKRRFQGFLKEVAEGNNIFPWGCCCWVHSTTLKYGFLVYSMPIPRKCPRKRHPKRRNQSTKRGVTYLRRLRDPKRSLNGYWRQLQYACDDAFFTLWVARGLLREAPGEAPHVLEALESCWQRINGAVAMEERLGWRACSVWCLEDVGGVQIITLFRTLRVYQMLIFPVAILSGAVLSSSQMVKHPYLEGRRRIIFAARKFPKKPEEQGGSLVLKFPKKP